MSYLEKDSYLVHSYLGEDGNQIIEPPSNVKGARLKLPGNIDLNADIQIPVIGTVKLKLILAVIMIMLGVWVWRKVENQKQNK